MLMGSVSESVNVVLDTWRNRSFKWQVVFDAALFVIVIKYRLLHSHVLIHLLTLGVIVCVLYIRRVSWCLPASEFGEYGIYVAFIFTLIVHSFY